MRAETPDQVRARRDTFRELLQRAVVADVLRQLADFVGHRRPRSDREMHEHLGPERLAKLRLTPQARMVAFDEGRVLQALGPDAEDDRAVLLAASSGCAARVSWPSTIRDSPTTISKEPFWRSARASSMFIAGLPMKPPTNMFNGRW